MININTKKNRGDKLVLNQKTYKSFWPIIITISKFSSSFFFHRNLYFTATITYSININFKSILLYLLLYYYYCYC
jgi:hypothetical protein